MSLPRLKLKRREDRRVRAGHGWIFSNEVDVAATPLADLPAGEQVSVFDHAGHPLGTALVNPASLICARMVSRRVDRPLDARAIAARVDAALRLRERLGFERCYRLVFGESDGLPGLVVDRHDNVLVVQIAVAGMEQLSAIVLDALESKLAPRAVLLRNDLGSRALEGLQTHVGWAHGEPVRSIEVVENGVRFVIDPLGGQKTGWYYDHRLTRSRVAAYARDARVLDVFSYLGGFGIQAAVAGAREVVCVDSSPTALDGVAVNAARNGVGARVRAVRGDAFEIMRELAESGERFDLVVTDPPAFARRRKDLPAATEAYRRLNRLAMRLLAPDGLLMAASCSSHVDRGRLKDCLRQAARGAGRQCLELESTRQGPDHPVHPAMPETEYLKAFLLLARA